MNIIQTFDQFSANEILLGEPIRNTVMDNSNFIRIITSNEDIIINGIYLYFTIISRHNFDKRTEHNMLNRQRYKKFLFILSKDHNDKIEQNIKNIERQILQKANITNKTKIYKLAEHMDEKIIKVFYEQNNSDIDNNFINYSNNRNMKNYTYNFDNCIHQNTKNINKELSESVTYGKFKDYKIILKISGIWENSTSYGITYKFMLVE